MKNSKLVLAMVVALLAAPAAAQQGPAGVPGAPFIGASIAPTPAPIPEAKKSAQRKRAPIDCQKAKDVEQCKARQEARKQAREACKALKGNERQQCINEKLSQPK
mgnify:CR=1 FL=1